MRQGKKTPPAVREWIVRAKVLFLEYTSKAIAELVKSNFNFELRGSESVLLTMFFESKKG